MVVRMILLNFLIYALSATLTFGACPRIITRKEWEAEPPEDVQNMPKPGRYIALHHTYIPGNCPTTDACKQAMKSMQNYHKHELKWGDIGYSFCIGGDGNIYEGRGWGKVGAHTLGWNYNSIGVCLIGDYRTQLPSSQMLKRIDELGECGLSGGHLMKNFEYFGHLQTSQTECPGKAFYEYIKKLPRWTPNPKKG